MSATYGWRSVTITVPTGTARVNFLPGNASRVLFLAGSDIGSTMRFSTLSGSGSDGLWLMYQPTNNRPLTFKDSGPIVQAELWISHLGAGSQIIVVTEVFRIRNC